MECRKNSSSSSSNKNTILTHSVSDAQGFQIPNGINPLQKVRKCKEGKVDEAKLPKLPLTVAGGSLIKAGLWIGGRVEVGPATKVPGDDDGNRQEGKDHNETLDGIRKGDTVEATNALKDQNENHNDNDGIGRVGIQSKNAIEGPFDGNDLGRQINNGRQNLQKDDPVPQELRLKAVRDEIRGGLVVAKVADLAESKARPDEPPTHGRHGRHPPQSQPTRLEGFVGNSHDGVPTEHAGKQGSRDDEGSEFSASNIVGRKLVAVPVCWSREKVKSCHAIETNKTCVSVTQMEVSWTSRSRLNHRSMQMRNMIFSIFSYTLTQTNDIHRYRGYLSQTIKL